MAPGPAIARQAAGLPVAAGVFVGLGAVAGLAGVFYSLSLDLPAIGPMLRGYDPPQTTRIYAADGTLVGELFEERRTLVPIEKMPQVMVDAVIAAEDANFCLHWGFGMEAIREALEDGGTRGASTITQQTVKNVFLWHGRSWARKALEALITPVVETVWTKRRIMEVYLNVAEFDEGVFGAEAASRTAFRVGPEELEPWQAARLAAVLPNPKGRSAQRPSSSVRRRAAAIADGAETIRTDGRFDCISTGAE